HGDVWLDRIYADSQPSASGSGEDHLLRRLRGDGSQLSGRKKPGGSMMKPIVFIAAALALSAAPKPRARDLGGPFDGTPGGLHAITDVRSVEVGQTTLIRGE